MTMVQQTTGGGGAVATVPAPLPSRLRHPLARRRVLRQERAQHQRNQQLAWRAQDVFTALGLFQKGSSIAGGPSFRIPVVTYVDLGPPIRLTIRTLPGQVPEDFTPHAATIAHNLGMARVRVINGGASVVYLELFATDPLAGDVPLPRNPLASIRDLVLLGVDDGSIRYRISPFDLVHLAIQGSTGSGKSVFVYGLLAQLVTTPNLLVAMSDPTGLLTRPFTGTVHEEWQVAGTADPDEHLALLERLVDTMDQRIATLAPRRDQVDIGEGCPLIFLVLEEYAGLLRAAATGDGSKKGGRVDQIKDAVLRLITEGRKAGIRLVILAQRFEAAVVSGFARSQCTVKLTFRVDNADSVAMLHPTGRDEADEHATCEPGVALLTGPGVPLARIRSPFIGHDPDDTAYGRYWDLITANAVRVPSPSTPTSPTTRSLITRRA